MRRRRLLVLAGASAGAVPAGCVDAKTDILVTNTQRVYLRGDRRFDYPDDVLYLVSIENRGPQRQGGRLEMTLVHNPADGQRRTWSRTDDISLSRGTSVRRDYVFEDVVGSEHDIQEYSFEAELVQ